MSDWLDAKEIASSLGIKLDVLQRMARNREFPELLRVTRGTYRVRRSDYESWEASRMTGAEVARADLAWARTRELLRGERACHAADAGDPSSAWAAGRRRVGARQHEEPAEAGRRRVLNCSAAFPGPRGNRTADVAYPKPPKRGALLGILLVLATFVGALVFGRAVWS